jgi:uncharacterized membrane protein YbaN (DUF454 family)
MRKLFQFVEIMCVAASAVAVFINMMPEATFLLVLATFMAVLRMEKE